MFESEKAGVLLNVVNLFGTRDWKDISNIKPDDREKAKKFYNLIKKFSIEEVAETFNVSSTEVSLLNNKCSYWKPVEPVTIKESLE